VKEDPTFAAVVHKEIGRGDHVVVENRGPRGKVLKKAPVLSMEQMEAHIIPLGGSKEQITSLHRAGITESYTAFHEHMLDVVRPPFLPCMHAFKLSLIPCLL
jgi:hypothetical protein